MAPPSKLGVATSALLRLVKEEASYHKELEQQEARIAKLESSTGDENAEYQLKQEVCVAMRSRRCTPNADSRSVKLSKRPRTFCPLCEPKSPKLCRTWSRNLYSEKPRSRGTVTLTYRRRTTRTLEVKHRQKMSPKRRMPLQRARRASAKSLELPEHYWAETVPESE